MPSNVVKSFAKKAGISLAKAEEKWKEAKNKVKEQYKDLSEKDDRFYALVTAIFKKMVGVEENYQSFNEYVNRPKSPIITNVIYEQDDIGNCNQLKFNVTFFSTKGIRIYEEIYKGGAEDIYAFDYDLKESKRCYHGKIYQYIKGKCKKIDSVIVGDYK